MVPDRFGQFAQRVAAFGLPGQGPDAPRAIPVVPQDGDTPGFGELLTKAINEVSAASEASSEVTQRFLRGENVELHQVMAASAEAGIALDVLVEVRNKVLEAYRTVMQMQA